MRLNYIRSFFVFGGVIDQSLLVCISHMDISHLIVCILEVTDLCEVKLNIRQGGRCNPHWTPVIKIL